MKNSKLLKALSEGLKTAIAKLDDDTKEWIKGVSGQPVWTNTAVDGIRDLESVIAAFLENQKKEYVKRLKKIKLPVKKTDSIDDALIEAFKKLIAQNILFDEQDFIDKLTELAQEWAMPIIEKVTQDVLVSLNDKKKYKQLNKKTVDWLNDHTIKFAKEVQQTTHDSCINAMTKAMKEGKGIEQMANIMENLPEFTRYRAKMVARTETIAACNAGELEGYRQSDVVIGKEWASASDERTRLTHDAADGQKRKLDEPFIVGGYKLMHPGDSSLGAPAKEVIHCRCTTYPIIEGESLESNTIYDDKDAGTVEWLKRQDKTFQIQYLGGYNKYILLQADAISEKDFAKPLIDLKNDGIILVPRSTLEHSSKGEFTKPKNPKKETLGKFKSGGHGQENINYLESHSIEYNIVKEYANGVRVGNVPSHAERTKRSGNYQSWFPKDWDNEKILIAATYTVNLKRKDLFYKKNIVDKQGNVIGYCKFAKYENVVVVIVADKNNIVATIFPDSLQRSIEEMKKGG